MAASEEESNGERAQDLRRRAVGLGTPVRCADGAAAGLVAGGRHRGGCLRRERGIKRKKDRGQRYGTGKRETEKDRGHIVFSPDEFLPSNDVTDQPRVGQYVSKVRSEPDVAVTFSIYPNGRTRLAHSDDPTVQIVHGGSAFTRRVNNQAYSL
jgi:hypothetical protein